MHSKFIIKPKDFETRFGVTKEAISDSNNHSITITHSYINGCSWYLKLLYPCHADCQVWIESSTCKGDHIRRSKEIVRETIKRETGLRLEYVNTAGATGGTSTTAAQARRFFSTNLQNVIRNLLSERNNMKHQANMLKLHEQLMIVFRVVSSRRKIKVEEFKKHCLETIQNIGSNFQWAKLNHTLHGDLQHNCELIEMNGGESLGWYSEEGLEANNKAIREFLEKLSRKNPTINKSRTH